MDATAIANLNPQARREHNLKARMKVPVHIVVDPLARPQRTKCGQPLVKGMRTTPADRTELDDGSICPSCAKA